MSSVLMFSISIAAENKKERDKRDHHRNIQKPMLFLVSDQQLSGPAFLPEVFSFQVLWVPFPHLSHGRAAFTSVVTARKETHAGLTQCMPNTAIWVPYVETVPIHMNGLLHDLLMVSSI